MAVAVVVPWRPGCPHREAAWSWVRDRYRTAHPDWDLIEAAGPGGPWVKADAVRPALEETSADTVVVADADVWTDGLAQAVDAIAAGVAWAIPHGHVRRLTETATADVLAGRDPDTITDMELAEKPYLGVAGGGIVVASRQLLLDVPLDARFVGWGGEDLAWGCALETLAGGPWRSNRPLIHLWHPPQPRPTRRTGRPESEALRRQYWKAHGCPDLMRHLLAGATRR